jgi:predicted MPP superfamily phosphohydrolase
VAKWLPFPGAQWRLPASRALPYRRRVIVFAHLSDTHLDGSARAAARTEAVMAYLDRLPYDLDAVLVTGDIADHGRSAEYEEARAVLASRHPVLTCPGNHDVRAPYRQRLLDEPAADGPVNRVHRVAGRCSRCATPRSRGGTTAVSTTRP